MSLNRYAAWLLAALACLLAVAAIGSLTLAHAQKTVKVPAPHLPQLDAGS